MATQDEYEVRIYDARSGRRLVAAIEIVSTSHKDRPESRQAFLAKLVALVQKDVCVSIVDLVTVRQRNFYADLLELLGCAEAPWDSEPPHLYAATLRGRRTWFYPLALGQPLPTLLAENLGVALDLEATYEDTCRILHIT